MAIIWPEYAEKLFSITGATGVLLVSYVLPVLVHFKLYWTRRRPEVVSSDQEAWLLEDASLLEADLGGVRGMSRRDSSVAVVGGSAADREQEDIEPGMSDSGPESPAGGSRTSAAREPLEEPLLTLRPAPNVVERPGGYPHIREIRKMPYWKVPFVLFWHLVLPLLVLVLGVGTSILTLALSVKKFK